MPLPKNKLEEFSEELKRAKTLEEIEKLADKIYNYAYINNDMGAYIFAAEIYIALNDIEKASKIIEFLEDNRYFIPKVRIIKARILMKQGKIRKSLSTLETIWKSKNISNEEKREAFYAYLMYLVLVLKNYEKAIKKLEEFGIENLEKFNNHILKEVPDYIFDQMTQVYHQLKKYQQAKEKIERYGLFSIIKKIEKELQGYKYVLSYNLDYDYEDPVEKIDINIALEGIDKKKVKKIEDKLIDLTLDVEPEIYVNVFMLKEIYV